MGNLAIINAVSLSALARDPVCQGPSALQRVLEWAQSIPEASRVVFLAGPQDETPDGFPAVRRDTWTESIFIEALSEAVDAAGPKDSLLGVFYVWGDAPLIDPDVTRILWDLHYRYDAEYTFADGYPRGVAPELFSPRLPDKLLPLARNRQGGVERNSLFEILRTDINAFDVETHLSPKDLRMDRVSITCDTRRNRNILERLYKAGGVDADSLCRIVPTRRDLLRDLPIYFPIQITDHSPQTPSYGPYGAVVGDLSAGKRFIDPKRFAELCQMIVDFAGDAVIMPSLIGEPASHPQIGGLLSRALAVGSTKVLVETSGIGWDDHLLENLARDENAQGLLWIVTLDAMEPNLYRELRGEGQGEAEATARKLVQLFGDKCWIQAVRMNENEEHLEDFYKSWTEYGAQVIIQKYNTFAGFLPNRQPADLSPLDRFPCWHLKRDMPILIDGNVPICIDDLGRRDFLGNVYEDGFEKVWSAGEKLHQNHVKGDYPGPCAVCDEYYTFNF